MIGLIFTVFSPTFPSWAWWWLRLEKPSYWPLSRWSTQCTHRPLLSSKQAQSSRVEDTPCGSSYHPQASKMAPAHGALFKHWESVLSLQSYTLLVTLFLLLEKHSSELDRNTVMGTYGCVTWEPPIKAHCCVCSLGCYRDWKGKAPMRQALSTTRVTANLSKDCKFNQHLAYLN